MPTATKMGSEPGSGDDVMERLRTRIASGVLPPGSHLTEAALAKEFGVSRTPVRTALRTLADEGMVTIEPNRGAFVAEWTAVDAAEIMRLRTILESHAAERAARYRNDAQLTRMRSLCDEMDSCLGDTTQADRSRISMLNRQFHETVLEAARSPRLYSITSDLAQTPLMSSSYQYYSPEQIRRSLGDHRLILQAIRAGDQRTASSLMDAHLCVAYVSLTQRSHADLD